MIINLGNGNIEVVTITQDERVGVVLHRQNEAHEIGEFSNTGGQEYRPEEHEQDVTIWLNKLESARILQDTINQAVLKMQGIPRDK